MVGRIRQKVSSGEPVRATAKVSYPCWMCYYDRYGIGYTVEVNMTKTRKGKWRTDAGHIFSSEGEYLTPTPSPKCFDKVGFYLPRLKDIKIVEKSG